MADADEDLIPASPLHPSSTMEEDPDDDLEDLTQDYRLLTTSRTTPTTLPKRGTKDFEPNPTLAQSSALDASRQAMHNALWSIRVHAAGKNHNVGIYVGDRERRREERFRISFEGEGEECRCVVVCKWRSTLAKTMGRADRRGWVWLLPEEALYLVERGSLDVRWGEVQQQLQQEDEEEEEERDPEPAELPMSLQGAYATLIGTSGLSLERYLVYAGLKRAGYILQRAPTWFDEQDGQVNGHIPASKDSETPRRNPQDCQPDKSAAVEAVAVAPDGAEVIETIRQVIAQGVEMDLDEITETTDLSSLGMDSLIAMAVRSKLWTEYEIDLSPFVLMHNPSLGHLRKALSLDKPKAAPPVDIAVQMPPATSVLLQEKSDPTDANSTSLIPTTSSPAHSPTSPTLIQRLLSWLLQPSHQASCPTLGPLLAPGLYRNYNDVFRALALIPYHQTHNQPTSIPSQLHPRPQHHPSPPFTISFHVWKPAQPYRKSAPSAPAYHLSVVDARTTHVPTAAQIGDLLDSMPYAPMEKEEEKRIEARLKHGRRSVVIAVVDTGVVSYLRFAESGSGGMRLFEERRGRGGKGRGGAGGGRGRGGNRGGKR